MWSGSHALAPRPNLSVLSCPARSLYARKLPNAGISLALATNSSENMATWLSQSSISGSCRACFLAFVASEPFAQKDDAKSGCKLPDREHLPSSKLYCLHLGEDPWGPSRCPPAGSRVVRANCFKLRHYISLDISLSWILILN